MVIDAMGVLPHELWPSAPVGAGRIETGLVTRNSHPAAAAAGEAAELRPAVTYEFNSGGEAATFVV